MSIILINFLAFLPFRPEDENQQLRLASTLTDSPYYNQLLAQDALNGTPSARVAEPTKSKKETLEGRFEEGKNVPLCSRSELHETEFAIHKEASVEVGKQARCSH